MKFEILLDKDVLREQLTLNLKLSWDEYLNKNKKVLTWSLFFITLGALLIYNESNIGYILVAFGIHYLLNYYSYQKHYIKSKRSYLDNANKLRAADNLNMRSIWGFNDETFYYKDHNLEVVINWTCFKSYRIIEQNLFLDLDIFHGQSYILSKSEVGCENFEKIVEFVKEKIK